MRGGTSRPEVAPSSTFGATARPSSTCSLVYSNKTRNQLDRHFAIRIYRLRSSILRSRGPVEATVAKEVWILRGLRLADTSSCKRLLECRITPAPIPHRPSCPSNSACQKPSGITSSRAAEISSGTIRFRSIALGGTFRLQLYDLSSLVDDLYSVMLWCFVIDEGSGK